MVKPDQYADALRDLDQMHAQGKIGAAEYELHKSRLLAEAAVQPRRPLWLRWLIFLAGIVLVVSMLYMCSGGGAGDRDRVPSTSEMMTQARLQCRHAVKDKLKSPATADFSNETESGSGQTGTYTVTGSVDSENSFGATVRSDFTCNVRFVTGEAKTVQITTLVQR